MTYENKRMQQKALQIIPVHDLEEKSQQNYNLYKKSLSREKTSELPVADKNEFFLMELLNWYKNQFFEWVDQPECGQCGTKEFMRFEGSSMPNETEAYGWANNVEVYKCSSCQSEQRFPRYNNPEVLLQTRKGRCGEWANCFALCLRSLNFETRYVLDWTDHVWCEVFSMSQRRWIHIDPCEAALDKPLIYEYGWGKKLTYVIAFSIEEVVDVTWRYSSKHADVLKRRNECDELWLVDIANKMTNQRQSALDKHRLTQLELRYFKCFKSSSMLALNKLY
jgi:peptide-N4-(N-acetyl-beta-glucosaminyl)asparagine amidase